MATKSTKKAATPRRKARDVTANVTANAREAFLDTLRTGYSISKGARNAKVSRMTVYRWRDEDDAFRAAWDDALSEGNDVLVDEAQRRAVDGVEEPVVNAGRVAKDDDGNILKVRKFSDSLLQTLLKARLPLIFRENAKVQLEHSGEVAVKHDPTETFTALAGELDAIAARIAGGIQGAAVVDEDGAAEPTDAAG